MTIHRICSVCKEINDPKEMKLIKGEYVCEKCQQKINK